jgi:hypothetical protein
MRHNGDRRPEEIQAEIARTRGDMDATLTAIEQRLTPGQLIDQGIDYLRSSGANEFVHNLGGSVKSNPMPVALVGIGLAWLMASGGRKPSPSSSYMYAEGDTGGPGIKQRAAEGMASAKERVSSMKDTVAQYGQSARARLGQVDSLAREQPLALGAIGLAVGAFMAAMLPRSQKEDELLGEASDRLKEQAQQAGRQQVEKVSTVAKEVVGQAKEAIGQEKPKPEKPRAQGAAPKGPNVIEPARATPLEGVKPKDPRLGTP